LSVTGTGVATAVGAAEADAALLVVDAALAVVAAALAALVVVAAAALDDAAALVLDAALLVVAAALLVVAALLAAGAALVVLGAADVVAPVPVLVAVAPPPPHAANESPARVAPPTSVRNLRREVCSKDVLSSTCSLLGAPACQSGQVVIAKQASRTPASPLEAGARDAFDKLPLRQ